MNATIVLQVSRAVHAGRIAFPDVVRQLLAAGVESYRVDYVAGTATHYGPAGEVAMVPLGFEGLPPVAATFDAVAVVADVRDSQAGKQDYRTFSARAMQAGVACYTAHLCGQQVVYCGRHGDQHVEWFPGAGPRTNPGL